MSERKAGGFEQGNRRVRTREFGGIGEGVEHKMKEKGERGSGLVRERRSRSAGKWEVSWREGKKRARDKTTTFGDTMRASAARTFSREYLGMECVHTYSHTLSHKDTDNSRRTRGNAVQRGSLERLAIAGPCIKGLRIDHTSDFADQAVL